MMLKRLRRIAIGILPWIIGGAVVGGAIVFVASKQHHAAEEYETAREKRCASSFPLDPKKQDACKHERDGPKNYLPWGYVLVAWPEGITTWAIIVTLVMIGWQSTETREAARATRDSADATLKSVKLQKIQLRQWVDLDGWEGHSEHFFPTATRTTYWMTFWITNPTKMPLTLNKVNITVPDGRPVWKSEGDDFVISPENGFRVQWPTVVADETMKRLVEGTWTFTLVIDVDFVDGSSGEPSHSQLTVGCKCRPTSCEIYEYRNRQPTEPSPQSPN